MAKTDTPAEALSPAWPHRGSRDARLMGGVPPADLFDARPSLHPRPMPPQATSAQAMHQQGQPLKSGFDVRAAFAARPDRNERNAGFGSARARDREREADAALLDEEDVIAEDAVTDELIGTFGFGAPRGTPASYVPLVTLEPPSAPQLELTPSPVPRVALAPATGAVDISLVPGPQGSGSRNLPTLAAQHLLGRRQRRPAAASTMPPPGSSASQAPPAPREPIAAGLAKDVRSSKREIVLGLTIGLGLSMLLAAAGQAYLGEEGHEHVVAGSPTAPALQSLTLSARPETAPANDEVAAAINPSGPIAGGPVASSPVLGSPSSGSATSGIDAKPSSAPAASAEAFAESAQHVRGAPEATAAGISAPFVTDGLQHGGAPRRTSGVRATAAAASRKAAPAASALVSEPPAFEAGKSFDAPPNDRTPMSPAESAGLGLDLPL